LGDAESAARRALDNLNNDTLRKSREMHATQAANLAVYLFSLGKSDEARTAALDAIRLGSGSFVAVPLQHIAAIIAPTDARRAARLLGYVDAVFASTAFTRQHSERFTYDALMASLNTQLSEDALAECMREGASMSERLAVQQATAAPCVDSV
jgi:hypothetical protein